MDRIWLFDRNFPGAARIARLTARARVLIRLKSDIRLKMVSEIFPDGSCLAEMSGDGVTVTVRVIEYYADVGGQDVPEMLCLATDLRDWREYPAADLAALCRWRRDGSETALREAESAISGAGPPAGPMLRSKTPDLVRQELAAIRHGAAGYQALTSAISRCRIVIDRNRHRARKAKARPAFPGAGPGTATRTAEAVITVCNTPA